MPGRVRLHGTGMFTRPVDADEEHKLPVRVRERDAQQRDDCPGGGGNV
jgi:hypothetical protein